MFTQSGLNHLIPDLNYVGNSIGYKWQCDRASDITLSDVMCFKSDNLKPKMTVVFTQSDLNYVGNSIGYKWQCEWASDITISDVMWFKSDNLKLKMTRVKSC